MEPQPYSPSPVAVFVLCCLVFLLSMFFRVSAAVISPELAAEFSLDSADLGRLSGAFFYAFAACQVPVGLAIDRLGPRRTVAALALVGAAGSLVFATATGFGAAVVGRVLLGVGMSSNLMGPLALLAAWFPPQRFATLSGTIVAIGSAGMLLAATPLALLTRWLGWRYSFLVMAVVTALLGAAFYLVARDRPAGVQPPDRPTGNPLAGLGRLMRMPAYWAISLATFIRYGAYMSLQGLWLAPLMTYGLGLTMVQAANGLLAMALGQMAGLPLFGMLSDRVLRSRKWTVAPSLLAMTAATLALVAVPRGLDLGWVMALCFFIGLAAAPGQIMYAHIKELVPAGRIGTAMTGINMFTMLGPAAMMEAVGWVMTGEPAEYTSPAQFHPAWWFLAGALGLAALVYLAVPDSKALKKNS